MLAMLTALLSAAAWADEAEVLRVEGPILITDLALGDGITVGQTVHLYKTMEVSDPRSGEVLVDHFEIGTGEVISVGETLSRIQTDASLAEQLSIGDQVRLSAEARTMVAVQPEVVEVLTEEAATFQDAFSEAAGAGRAARLAAWEDWLTSWPDAEMAIPVRRELSSLRAQPDAVASIDTPPAELDAVATAPPRVPERAAPQVVVSLREPEELHSVLLFYRHVSEQTFRYVPMQPSGDTTFQAGIPEDTVYSPGVEWFVEVRDDAGVSAVQGTAERPVRIAVTDQASPAEIRNRSQVTVFSEYVDFFAGSGADRYVRSEADFLYRLRLGALTGLRVGGGSFRGIGGDTSTLDALGAEEAATASEQVGYNFGYTELEFVLVDWLSVIGRGVIGVDYDGMALGTEGRVRFGQEEGTSLDLSAGRLGNIGERYIMQLSWNTVPRVPMSSAVELTDFPGVARADGPSFEDYGVRLIYAARYSLRPGIDVGGRVGYQLRNINHAGFSGGLQAVMSW